MNVRRLWFPTLLLGAIGAVLISTNLGVTQEVKPPARIDTGGARALDHQVKGLHVQTLDRDGFPTRTLSAAEVRRFEGDEATEMDKVSLLMRAKDEPSWKIDAERAWVSPNQEQVLLRGAVSIAQTDAKFRAVKMDTSNLRIQPEQHYAETDEPVRVASEKHRIDAVGMQAWFGKRSRIKFKSKVRGHHVVN